MVRPILIKKDIVSLNSIVNLENREVSLWIHDIPHDSNDVSKLITFLGLPWRSIVFENNDSEIIKYLKNSSEVINSMSRKRGFIHFIEKDPSRIQLPPRCLPIYLLDVFNEKQNISLFEKRLQRITMLDEFRRSNVRELFIFTTGENAIPDDLKELWSAGYRTQITVISQNENANEDISNWLEKNLDIRSITLINKPQEFIADEIVRLYSETYPEDRQFIRMRDFRGEINKIDVTEADELERPILDSFTLLQEKDLLPLVPEELSQDDFIGFFQNPETSWRPYAANLPWIRNIDCYTKLHQSIEKLEAIGPEENFIAYVSSESGAGGTTLIRTLSWRLASEGYPALVAKPFSFIPEALPLANYLTRIHRIHLDNLLSKNNKVMVNEIEAQSSDSDNSNLYYETPWVLVFDIIHWQNRVDELIKFRNELSKAGRVVCILIVTSNTPELSYSTSPIFTNIADLNHAITLTESRQLGQHLNEFLRYYGKSKTEEQWNNFHEEHTTRYLDGIAAFWVTLSFWIQGQYDLSDSIQQWVYAAFIEQNNNRNLQKAILEIAAMSTERFPIPQGLLPKMPNGWPTWQLLEDNGSNLVKLGLTQINIHGERHWAIVHDILGRFLINALFYDLPTRNALGLSQAVDPEQLRFQILKEISGNTLLGERTYISVGDEFAQEIFKVDPDHGKNNFAVFWRDVLQALDQMPQILRNTSRIFRHHTAISRRRIAKMDSKYYDIDIYTKIELLERAISDINYALTEIPFVNGSEPDLNLLNSVALAYFDLADRELEKGSDANRICEIKKLANDATKRAYHESPNNSFVMETYVRSILQNATDNPNQAIESCINALGIIYTASRASIETNRGAQLGRLAEKALDLLLQQTPIDYIQKIPLNPLDLLVQTWFVLAQGKTSGQEWSISNVSIDKQIEAIEILSNPLGKTNAQVLYLQYDLVCNCYPLNYKKQLELIEPLQLSESWLPPQLQLDYAILLYQMGRAYEGARIFRKLRKLWATSEYFVQVPERLRWLRSEVDLSPKIVRVTVSSEYGIRPYGIVQEFNNDKVPFRPEEHGMTNPKPGFAFRCFITFGYNGPFLRPLTSRPPTLR